MGFSNTSDAGFDHDFSNGSLDNNDLFEILVEDEFGGQTLDGDLSIEETQTLVDEFEQTLRS
jgi:hypothetical protein